MKAKHIILVLVTLFSTRIAQSQIVNIEEYRIRTDTTGWSGSASASAYINKNSDFVFSVLTNVQLQHKRPKTLWWLITDLATVRANDQEAFVNGGFEHLRFNYKISERWTWEVFVQGVINQPLGVDWKILSGTGPRYKLFHTDHFRAYVAALYMQETENNVGVEENLYFNRMSSYASFTYQFKHNSRLANTTYFQPVLNDFADYRIASNTSMKAFFTKTLFLEFEYSLFFDTNPPAGIPTTSYNLTSGIGLEF